MATQRTLWDTEGDPTHRARLARRVTLSPTESGAMLTAFNRQRHKNYAPLAAMLDKLQEKLPELSMLPVAAHVLMHPDTKYEPSDLSRYAGRLHMVYRLEPDSRGRPHHSLKFYTAGKEHSFTLPVSSVAEFHEAVEASADPHGGGGFDLSHLPEAPARLSRMGAAEVAEGYHEKLPHFALHDLLLENEWHHDQRTLDLLNGDAPVPKGHSVKAKVVPTGDGSHKVVAWHDEAPFHVRHGADLLRLRGDDAVYGHPYDHVTHGPGGLFGVMDGGDDYRDVFDLHPAHGFMRPGTSPRHFDTHEAAVAHAEERARGTTTH